MKIKPMPVYIKPSAVKINYETTEVDPVSGDINSIIGQLKTFAEKVPEGYIHNFTVDSGYDGVTIDLEWWQEQDSEDYQRLAIKAQEEYIKKCEEVKAHNVRVTQEEIRVKLEQQQLEIAELEAKLKHIQNQ